MWSLVSLLVVAVGVAVSEAVDCPPACKCSWVSAVLRVDCANQGLTEYPNFHDMPIEYLDLSHNEFTTFPQQLASIETLLVLDLTNNKIGNLYADSLDGFQSLSTLLLANNSFYSWADLTPNEAFAYVRSLKHLSLSGNSLGNYGHDHFANLLKSESLSVLELEGCGITEVDMLMSGLPNLEHLKLSRNSLYTLIEMPSISLHVLELRDCKLQYIDLRLLEGLPNLGALDLASNPSLQIQLGTDFNDNTLYQLDISFCNLDGIDLKYLPNLKTLVLRGNMLREIYPSTFANNTQLKVIDLARNSLRVLEANAFTSLPYLTKLDLSYNEINALDQNTFRSNEFLEYLDLSHNVIEKFSRLISSSIQDINLSSGEIATIDKNALSSLFKLKRINLSNNWLRAIPDGLQSETLKDLDLSNCRLSNLRNNTFRGLPELTTLRLNGNRFTNSFPVSYFSGNKYLDNIWIGDNPWICSCNDKTFIGFYQYLTESPEKLNDPDNLRCASPAVYYGRTWQSACEKAWAPESETAGKVWTSIMIILVISGILICMGSCCKKYLRSRKQRNDTREYRSNQEELLEIRRQNQRMLQEEGTPNAPSAFETSLPSYEDALRMPKPTKSKSEFDLTASNKSRKRIKRSRTQPEEEDDDLMLDNKQRFRSEEMLSNRDIERTNPIEPYRRTGYKIPHNNSGSRRFSIEESRFPAAHLKSQNLQSAEKIGNFQSYEYSPYTKRKPQIAEIPPFKRATLQADSVEFLTDPEFDAHSKPASPFARRRPKTTPPPPPVRKSPVPDFGGTLDPAIEDYFAMAAKHHSSNSSIVDGSFHVLVEADVASLPDDNKSFTELNLERGRQNKSKNSPDTGDSGSFCAVNVEDSSSSSDKEGIMVVKHKPAHETLF